MPLTKKAVVYLGLAYALIALTLIFRQPSFAIFVVPIAITFLYSSAFSRVEIPNLTVRRRLNPLRSFGGENIKVTVEVKNNLDSAITGLRVEDSVPSSLRVDKGSRSFNLSLKPHERSEHFYEISAPKRGRYLLGPIKASASDLMGFRQYSAIIPGQDAVTILPRVEDLGNVELSARRIGQWPGAILSRSIGPGTEFFELRLYSPGDELRRVNWKASARQARLVTNEFETERVTDVLVVLDCSEAVLSGLFPNDTNEFQVNLAASLCSQLLIQGNRVGVLVYGAQRTWVPPAFGKRQLLKILSSLTIAEAGRAIVPIDFVVETIVNAVLPARAVIAFISPLMDDEIIEVIRKVAASGYSIMCLTPTSAPSAPAETRPRVLAKKILEAKRRINLRQVVAVSRCFEISPNTSVRAILRRKLRWRPA